MNSIKAMRVKPWLIGLGLIAAFMLALGCAVTANAAEQTVTEQAAIEQTATEQAVTEPAAGPTAAEQTAEPAAAEQTPEEIRNAEAQALGYTSDELKLLASLIWCEAGNQPFDGQVAVGSVVMNRIKSDQFPDTISTVIYEKRQFEPVGTGWLKRVLRENNVPDQCYEAALEALAGAAPVGSCVYFERRGRYPKGITIADQCFWGQI